MWHLPLSIQSPGSRCSAILHARRGVWLCVCVVSGVLAESLLFPPVTVNNRNQWQPRWSSCICSWSSSILKNKCLNCKCRIRIMPFVDTPFITEDGCSGSDMASNMTYKCLPSAIPDESQNGSPGLPVDLQHPKDPLPCSHMHSQIKYKILLIIKSWSEYSTDAYKYIAHFSFVGKFALINNNKSMTTTNPHPSFSQSLDSSNAHLHMRK